MLWYSAYSRTKWRSKREPEKDTGISLDLRAPFLMSVLRRNIFNSSAASLPLSQPFSPSLLIIFLFFKSCVQKQRLWLISFANIFLVYISFLCYPCYFSLPLHGVTHSYQLLLFRVYISCICYVTAATYIKLYPRIWTTRRPKINGAGQRRYSADKLPFECSYVNTAIDMHKHINK